ncbi:hypothetical protein VTK26DRAFT_4954 [Humicola hyalothermophila]
MNSVVHVVDPPPRPGGPRCRLSRVADAGHETTAVPSGSRRWSAGSAQRGYCTSPTQPPGTTPWPGSSRQTLPAPTIPYPQQTNQLPNLQSASPDPGENEDGDDDDAAAANNNTATSTSEAPLLPTPPSPSATSDVRATLSTYPYSVYNHGTWTAEDDQTLLAARSRGMQWADLQRAHFPGKTANACRKRHERLVERRGITDYSARRLEAVASEYMAMRRDVWSGLAERVGMRWEVVEALCMSAGLRTIQSNARSYSNRARRDNRLAERAREVQCEVACVGSVELPPVGSHLGIRSDIGTAYAGHGVGQRERLGPNHADPVGRTNGRDIDTTMPPPPPPPPTLIPASEPPFTRSLPPVSELSFGGYPNGKSRPVSVLDHSSSKRSHERR